MPSLVTQKMLLINFKHQFKLLPGVGLQELDNVRMFEHVAYCGLSLEIVQRQPGRGGELGNIYYLHSKLLQKKTMMQQHHTKTGDILHGLS